MLDPLKPARVSIHHAPQVSTAAPLRQDAIILYYDVSRVNSILVAATEHHDSPLKSIAQSFPPRFPRRRPPIPHRTGLYRLPDYVFHFPGDGKGSAPGETGGGVKLTDGKRAYRFFCPIAPSPKRFTRRVSRPFAADSKMSPCPLFLAARRVDSIKHRT